MPELSAASASGKAKSRSEKENPRQGPRACAKVCRGRGSSGLLWAHFSVTCANSPFVPHIELLIYSLSFSKIRDKCGARTMAPSGEAREPARASWVLGSLVPLHHKAKTLPAGAQAASPSSAGPQRQDARGIHRCAARRDRL